MLYGFSGADADLQPIPNPCGTGYMLVPAVSASCGPEPGSLCEMYDAQHVLVTKERMSCVDSCPPGYVPALRRSPYHVGGAIRACLTPSALESIQKQQPGGARRALSDIEVGALAIAGVTAVVVIGTLLA